MYSTLLCAISNRDADPECSTRSLPVFHPIAVFENASTFGLVSSDLTRSALHERRSDLSPRAA